MEQVDTAQEIRKYHGKVLLAWMRRLSFGNRALDEKHVAKIVREFDESQVHTFILSKRNDHTYIILDGQHRHEAMLRLGMSGQEVDAEIFEGLSPMQEIEMSLNFNSNRRAWTPVEKFANAIAIGRSDAVAIQRAVEDAGFHVATNRDGSRENGRIAGIGALTHIADKYSIDTLRETLGIISDAYGTATGPEAHLLRGVAMFITRYRGLYDRPSLVNKLASTRSKTVEVEGKAAAMAIGLRSYEGVAFHILSIYNYRRSKNRLPAWHEMDGRRHPGGKK